MTGVAALDDRLWEFFHARELSMAGTQTSVGRSRGRAALSGLLQLGFLARVVAELLGGNGHEPSGGGGHDHHRRVAGGLIRTRWP